MSDLTVAPATTGAKIAAVGVIGTASALAAPAAAFAGTGDGPGGAVPATVNVAPAPVGLGYRVCAFYCVQGGYTYTSDGGLALQLGGGFGTPQAGPIINYKPYSSAIGLEGGAQIPGVSIAGGLNTNGLYVNGKSPVGNFNWSDSGGTTVNYGIQPTGLTQLGQNVKVGAQGLLLGSLNMGDLAKWWNNVTGANPPSDQPVQTGDGMWSYPPGYQPPPAHLTDWSDAFGPDELKQQSPQSSGQQQNGLGGQQQNNGVPQAGQQGSSGPQDPGQQGSGGPQSGAAQNGGQQGGATQNAAPQGSGQQNGAPQGSAQPGDGSQPGGAQQGGAAQGGAPQSGQPPAAPGQPANGAPQPADGTPQPGDGQPAGTADPAAPASAPASPTVPAAPASAPAAPAAPAAPPSAPAVTPPAGTPDPFGPAAPISNPSINLGNGQTFSSTGLGTSSDPLFGTAPTSNSGNNAAIAAAGLVGPQVTAPVPFTSVGTTSMFGGDPSGGGAFGGFSGGGIGGGAGS